MICAIQFPLFLLVQIIIILTATLQTFIKLLDSWHGMPASHKYLVLFDSIKLFSLFHVNVQVRLLIYNNRLWKSKPKCKKYIVFIANRHNLPVKFWELRFGSESRQFEINDKNSSLVYPRLFANIWERADGSHISKVPADNNFYPL